MRSKIYSNDEYDIFEQIFMNREDFISYLKSAKITAFFASRPASNSEGNDWYATKSFDEAMKLFEYGWYADFDTFLARKKQIDRYFPYITRKKSYFNNVCGSVPNVVNAINNLPMSMRKIYNNTNTQNIIRINYNCSTSCITSKSQIFNNGLLTLSLIDFFERLNYRIDLNFFEISKLGNQILYVNITLKSPGEKINLQKLYFAFCNPSFLRRLIFRVTETTLGLSREWFRGYGRVMKTEEIRKILGISETNILINGPMNMGVKGQKIEDDINSFIDVLSLGNYVKVNEKEFNIHDDKHMLTKGLSLR